jgi:hypothetical protein
MNNFKVILRSFVVAVCFAGAVNANNAKVNSFSGFFEESGGYKGSPGPLNENCLKWFNNNFHSNMIPQPSHRTAVEFAKLKVNSRVADQYLMGKDARVPANLNLYAKDRRGVEFIFLAVKYAKEQKNQEKLNKLVERDVRNILDAEDKKI